MFDIGASELLLIVVVAIVVIGPKDMPLALRHAGRWIGKMRRISNHFRSGLDAMIREAEMEEMEKEWRDQNAAIMAKHPAGPNAGPNMEPLAATADSRGRGLQAPADAPADGPDSESGSVAAEGAGAAADPAWTPHDVRPNAILDPEPPAATPDGSPRVAGGSDAADPTAMDRATHRAAAAESGNGNDDATVAKAAPDKTQEPRLPFAERPPRN